MPGSLRFSAGGYDLEALARDDERIFCGGWRDGAGGARKRVLGVLAAARPSTPLSLDRLAHEYALRDELDGAWAARPLELVREPDRTLLVLEDRGGRPLELTVGAPMEVGRFLRLAIAIAEALGNVHAAGLVHKDIKPAHILVDPAGRAVWLTGFGVATRLLRERQPPRPPEGIAGTLAYMAPEQTGRMNRSVDSRSDLYALGVTFYLMVTGSLPFAASDPMEWVHCHIARTPAPPHERIGNIPALISRIVMKLLAKTAEERYQTAAGVERDLRRCRAEWEAQGRIADFPLAERDAPDRLLIPEKLYGRSREVAALLGSFHRVVATGAPELVLVSGYSGIGKSSVVHELHKVLVAPRGLFAFGKFDQYMRDVPYATVAQAFQSLVRQILSKSDAELQTWRDALREALGPNGLLIVDLIPELELVIGKQPPLPDLSPQDAQRRVQTALRRFIGVFARPEHPLALFLDDLQWLDDATLDLLEDLLTHSDIPHLLLIGAYRDNEVDATHPLMRKLDAIRRTGATILDIVLKPLSHGDLGQLIADSLRCEPRRARPLVQLVQEKTGGNPFFSIQFLYALRDEALLIFDRAEARWSWRLDRIHAKRYTDNVVDLMAAKLIRLPAETRKALEQLACLGNVAEIATLSIILGMSEEHVHAALWEAMRLELIELAPGAYRFIHDRVHEAAYALIPEEKRAAAHLSIGRLLVAHMSPQRREEAVFEIVNQLNRGAELITDRDERERLAALNLIAGQRAKASAAYASALGYLIAGASLLAPDCWERRRELSFELELDRAECEFLTGAVAEAEQRLATLSPRAANTVEKATVACLRADLYVTLGRSSHAVEVGLDYLRDLSVAWSPHPTETEARREYELIWSQLGSRTIEELIDLPLMTDPASLATMDVLTKIAVPAYYTDANLLALVACRAINLSLERGNCDGSCFAYEWLGLVAGSRFGDYRAAYRFGRLGYDLIEKRGLTRYQARTYNNFAVHVLPWARHVKTVRPLLLRAFDAANRIGDLTFVAHACANLNTNLLAEGEPLAEVQREAEHGLVLAQRARFGFAVDLIGAQLGLVRTLRGLTPSFGSFDDEQFDESQGERRFAENPDLAFAECWYWIRKLQARFFAGDYPAAVEAASRAQYFPWTSLTNLETADYHFYGALSLAALHDSATPNQRQPQRAALIAHHRQLEIWAAHCPENFENCAALVGAEIARLDGRPLDAESLYEQAIRSARSNGFVHNEALACETAARFYAARGLEDFAAMFLARARDGYLRWGADGKVRQLETRYPRQAVADPPGEPKETTSADQQLDVTAVVEASQALSSEMILPRLIERLMTIALQNAGADRGLLILTQQHDYSIEAEARTDGEQIVLHYGASVDPAVPESIIRYVMRTQERVIVDDATNQDLFSADSYSGLRRARSILCLPLIRQGALGGLLYLENTLASHVFTPNRARLLELLASQAAISLENTRLYGEVHEREAKIRRLVDANIVGIFIWNFDGEIIEANEAFLRMVGYSREDLDSRAVRWTDLTPPEWREQSRWSVETLKATGTVQPYEREYFRKDGGRTPVLIGAATLGGQREEGVAFVIDLTDRKRAEAEARESQRRYREVQLELEHANRVAMIGQLSASIAHEVNQPIAAAVTNAQTALRWLDAEAPNLGQVRRALGRIVENSNRAAEVIGGIRSLIKKEPPRQDRLEINETIMEVVALTRGEVLRNEISVRTQLKEGLPRIQGDRVQLQQVLLNLIVNAAEAMTDADEGTRELLISTDESGASGVLVAIADTGPGLDLGSPERLFEAFYTTKPSGLGMGLPICRSIIEAHGGRLWASANLPHGAVFQFTVPAHGATDGFKPVLAG